MGDGKEKKFVLKIPDPIEINTAGCGRILFSHWTVAAIQDVSKILSRKPESPAAFVREFASNLGRVPSPGKDSLREQYEYGSKITSSDELTTDDVEIIAEKYLERFKDEMLYWQSSEREEASEVLDRREGEKLSEFLLRVAAQCVKKEEEHARDLLKKFNFLGASSEIFESLKRNQVQLDLVSQRMKQIASIPTLPTLESRTFEVPTLPQNPTYESNRLLGVQIEEIRSLIQLIQAQGEQAELLNRKTELLLSAAAQSGKQAKVGIWVAAVGILLSTGIGLYSLIATNTNETESTRLQAQNNEVLNRIHGALIQPSPQQGKTGPMEKSKATRAGGAASEKKVVPKK